MLLFIANTIGHLFVVSIDSIHFLCNGQRSDFRHLIVSIIFITKLDIAKPVSVSLVICHLSSSVHFKVNCCTMMWINICGSCFCFMHTICAYQTMYNFFRIQFIWNNLPKSPRSNLNVLKLVNDLSTEKQMFIEFSIIVGSLKWEETHSFNS